MTVAFLIPLDPHIERVEKDNMKSVVGLLLALAICKGVTASGGNDNSNTKDSYTINISKWMNLYTPSFPAIYFRFTVEMRGHS